MPRSIAVQNLSKIGQDTKKLQKLGKYAIVTSFLDSFLFVNKVHSLAYVVNSLEWEPSETFYRRMHDPAKNYLK